MKKQLAKLALTAVLGLALTFTQAAAEKPPEKAVVGTFTDTRDKKTYKTVKIGTQTWMAENLNYNANGSRCYGEGGKIIDFEGIDAIPSTPSKAYIQARCKKYGRLYNWETAMKACPSGWHLPSTAEWGVLESSVGGKETAGISLKTKSGWNEIEGDISEGTDKFGFSALPGGYGYSGVDFYYDGYDGFWWSFSEKNNRKANIRMNSQLDHIGYEYGNDEKNHLYSIRCIKD